MELHPYPAKIQATRAETLRFQCLIVNTALEFTASFKWPISCWNTTNCISGICGECKFYRMHIKSIIIEGFKSYAQRTEINGFDPLFNAITGLNGSGKSNILDSICFLLGISNLSHVSCYTSLSKGSILTLIEWSWRSFPILFFFYPKVRASNLQDLVYKNGQGGITKATVSITFDNSNKSQSPLGFETHDEITVTRQVELHHWSRCISICKVVVLTKTVMMFSLPLKGGNWW